MEGERGQSQQRAVAFSLLPGCHEMKKLPSHILLPPRWSAQVGGGQETLFSPGSYLLRYFVTVTQSLFNIAPSDQTSFC